MHFCFQILAPALPNGTHNQLRTKMGDQYIDMLLDILVHVEGPRLRDHLSHGELLDLDSISQSLCHHILCISLVFAVHFNNDAKTLCKLQMNSIDPYRKCSDLLSENCDEKYVESGESDEQLQQQLCAELQNVQQMFTGDTEKCLHKELDSCSRPAEEKTSSDFENLLTQIVKISQSYQSVNHPFAVLKREIDSASKRMDKFKEVLVPDEFLQDKTCDLSYSSDVSQKANETMQKALESLNETKRFPVDLRAVCCTDVDFSKEMKHLCDCF